MKKKYIKIKAKLFDPPKFTVNIRYNTIYLKFKYVVSNYMEFALFADNYNKFNIYNKIEYFVKDLYNSFNQPILVEIKLTYVNIIKQGDDWRTSQNTYVNFICLGEMHPVMHPVRIPSKKTLQEIGIDVLEKYKYVMGFSKKDIRAPYIIKNDYILINPLYVSYHTNKINKFLMNIVKKYNYGRL